MRFDLANIKKQFQQNRAKSLVLLGLSVLMVGLLVQTFCFNAPRQAAAMPVMGPTGVATPALDARAQAELEQRIHESSQLWLVLNENRAAPADQAFRFESASYRIDPARQAMLESARTETPPGSPQVTVPPAAATHPAAAPDAAPKFVLQFTLTGAHPSALIDSRVVHIGDLIDGYRVMDIQAFVVVLEKDGKTVSLNMAKRNKTPGAERDN